MSSILDGYYTEDELANELDKSIRTLRLWRQKRTGPPWTSCGETVLYARDSVLAWLKSQEQQPVRLHRQQPRRKPSAEQHPT